MKVDITYFFLIALVDILELLDIIFCTSFNSHKV